MPQPSALARKTIRALASTTLGWKTARLLRKPGALVLLYHRIGAPGDFFPGLDVSVFHAQMKWLAAHCTPISPDQLRNAVFAGRSARPPVLVTFDDGYLSYRERAYPILKASGIPALLFLSTAYIDEPTDEGRGTSKLIIMVNEHQDLKDRTKKFALRIIKLVDTLPKTIAGRNIGHQLFRGGTSTAGNYRAAGRARSNAEFIAKMCIVEEEADESAFWLEIIIESKLMKKELVEPLWQEANELIAIFVSIKKNVKNRFN